MGGIYARHEGLPEAVWKAIYFHYLPVGVEADAPPSRVQVGHAAVTWRAVSLADKLDTIVGLFAAGEKPTGSRDPYGLRRAAQGVVKILADLDVDGIARPDGIAGIAGIDRIDLRALLARAFDGYAGALTPESGTWMAALEEFIAERELHMLERRGFRVPEGRAVISHWARPASVLKRASALAHARKSKDFEALAILFKRVKNITKGVAPGLTPDLRARLTEPAELALLGEFDARLPAIERAVTEERYAEAMRELGALSGPVDRFFVDVLVMAEDRTVRQARLALLTALRGVILDIADIAEIAPEDAKQV
jgi:glycyl-tRNA synthetase beta chain